MAFYDVKGQDRAIELLLGSFLSQRVPHAYLFYGPEGVGKHKVATLFAQLLNCEHPLDGKEPCQTCGSCRKISSGSHPDIITVKPEGASIKIAQMRMMQERAFYKCYEGRIKVIMVEEAQLLTSEAANSLLKILEEPPRDTLFILITQDTRKLPLTVLSRCQGIPFTWLSDDDIADIFAQQGLEVRIPLVLAQGSMGRALVLNEKTKLSALIQEVGEMLAGLKNSGYHEIFSQAEKLEKDKELVSLTLEILAAHYRDQLIREINRPGGQHDTGTLLALEEITKVDYYLKSNANTRLVLEVLLINLRNIERRERGYNPDGKSSGSQI